MEIMEINEQNDAINEFLNGDIAIRIFEASQEDMKKISDYTNVIYNSGDEIYKLMAYCHENYYTCLRCNSPITRRCTLWSSREVASTKIMTPKEFLREIELDEKITISSNEIMEIFS